MPDSGADQLHMEAAGGTAPVTLDHEARVVRGCTETGTYVLSVRGVGRYRVFVDDVELARRAGENHCWSWTAGFFAGEVPIEIVDDVGVVRATWRLDVSPVPDKLGRDEFQAMAEEIFAFNPALLFGDQSAQAKMGAQGDYTSAALRYARLRQFVPYFLQALRRVQQRPQVRLESRRESLPLHRARRMDAATVRRAALHGPSARLLAPGGSQADTNTFFDVPSTRSTVDNPGNRTLLALLKAVVRRVRAVHTELHRAQHATDGPHVDAAYKAPLARRLEWLAAAERELRLLSQGTMFSQVSRLEVSSAGLNIIAAHPDYARAYRMGWQSLRPGLAGARSQERLWMSPTWEVFERWAFLRVTQAVQETVPGLPAQTTYPTRRDDHVRFSWAMVDGRIDVWLQPRFPAQDQTPAHGFRSVSGERYPDIVIAVERAGWRRFVVLDAKYRVSRFGVLEGMESAHLYRDSLRWHGRPPEAALLVLPAGGGAPWLEQADFQDREQVGAIVLPRHEPCARLLQLLRSLIS